MSVLVGGYQALVRPVLFRAGGGDPEVAHRRMMSLLGRLASSPRMVNRLARLMKADAAPRTVFGIRFPGAVGLAGGMDKDGKALIAWRAMGFGFVEAGTVTALPQPGNPAPRVFRLPASAAIINRMGFNNDGAQALADRLAALSPAPLPIGVSLGKSKVTPLAGAVPDYLSSFDAVQAYADYIAVNVSSPNTPGLRSLQDAGMLRELLGELTARADTSKGPCGPVPVLVKIAPDATDESIGQILEVAESTGAAGVIATNTTLARDGIAASDVHMSVSDGGLSGRPLRARALEVVRFVTGHSALPVIGVGGIGSAEDGLAMLDAGASLLQVYTGLIYAGPGLIRSLNAEIARRESR